jgi:hypothetical protein
MDAGRGANRQNLFRRVDVLAPIRLVLLLALVCCSVASFLVAIRHQPLSLWIEVVLACGPSFLLAWLLVRQHRLAALSTFAPLPGVLIFLATTSSGVASLDTGLGLALGLTVSVLLAARSAAAIGLEETPGRADTSAAHMNLKLVMAILAVFELSVLIAGIAIVGAMHWDVAAVGGLAIVSACVMTRLGLPHCEGGEEYVVRSNRWREIMARTFAPLLPVARPRFGLSVFGIGCVLSAIAFFGMSPLHFGAAIGFWPVSIVAGAVIVSSCVVLRDWRSSLSVVLSTALATHVSLGAVVMAGVPAASMTPAVLFAAVSLVFAFQLCVAQEALDTASREHDVMSGSEHAIETNAMAICIACLTGLAAALPFGWGGFAWWICFSAVLIAGAVAAVIFQPAITITLESLLPRPETVALRYKLR